jgi:hypothetical protein
MDSLVPYDLMPTPWVMQQAFTLTAPHPQQSVRELLDEPEPEERIAKEREIFVNAQWAFGSQGTGAPVSTTLNVCLLLNV